MKYGWLIYSIFHPLTQAARLSAFQRRVDALAVSVVFSAGLEQVWNQHSTSFPKKKLNRETLEGLVTQALQRSHLIPPVSTASPQCSAALKIFLTISFPDWWVHCSTRTNASIFCHNKLSFGWGTGMPQASVWQWGRGQKLFWQCPNRRGTFSMVSPKGQKKC